MLCRFYPYYFISCIHF